MTNRFDEMRSAVEEARTTLRALDRVVDTLADMLVGRMRKVSPYYLKKLKKELHGFNAQTGRWKE